VRLFIQLVQNNLTCRTEFLDLKSQIEDVTESIAAKFNSYRFANFLLNARLKTAKAANHAAQPAAVASY